MMRTVVSMLAVLGVTVAVLGCGKGESGRRATGSGSDTLSPAPHAVEIFVNDASVAKVTAAQLGTWPRVDTLVPSADRRLGTWTKVKLVGATASELSRPSAAFPDKVPVLFPGAAGAASFGMFDPVELAKRGPAAMTAAGVTEVRILVSTEGRGGEHSGGTGEGTDPSKLVLVFETATGETQLTGTQIIGLARETVDDQQGWKLSALLTAAGVTTPYQQLVLLDAGGASIVLPKADFDDTAVIPFVKLNKQGALRFRIYTKQGAGWQATADLRALSRIKVR